MRTISARRITTALAAVAMLLAYANCAASARITSAQDRYEKLVCRLRKLASNPCVRLIRLGTSVSGRPIYGVILTRTDDCRQLQKRPRLLILCGQHGDEPMSTASMLDLAGEMADGGNRHLSALLGKAVVALVPVVNPDGFSRSRRMNADGADLNRDWVRLSQPETRCVSRFVHEFRPSAVLDAHEWTISSPDRPNWVEVSGAGRRGSLRLSRLLARRVVHTISGDLAIRYVNDHIACDPRLAHREFASRGLCSMLVETSPTCPKVLRYRIYRECAVSLLSSLADPPSRMIAADLQAASAGRSEFSVASLYGPTPTKPRGPNWLPAFALMGCLALYGVGGRRKSAETSDEAYKESRPGRGMRLSVQDTVKLDVPTRVKLSLMKTHHLRATERRSTTC